MRIFSKTFIFLATACFFVYSASAQKTPNKIPVASSQKFKAPKLYTFLSTYKDSVSVPVEVAENILAAALKIYDDKKVEYKVSSYQFLYRKKTVTEDEQTGKVSPASSIFSNLFVATPLPEFWINQIRDQVKSGEELYFFDVIAKDALGRVMYAPSVKIMIQ